MSNQKTTKLNKRGNSRTSFPNINWFQQYNIFQTINLTSNLIKYTNIDRIDNKKV